MSQVKEKTISNHLVLKATAGELMSANPISLRADAALFEAIELLARHGFGAAPVIDFSGRAVGVVSSSDVIVHQREQLAGSALTLEDGDDSAKPITRIRDIMTPVVFSVTPDSSAAEVVKQMLDWKIHHLFVVDQTGVLIGIISSLDILRHLGGDA